MLKKVVLNRLYAKYLYNDNKSLETNNDNQQNFIIKRTYYELKVRTLKDTFAKHMEKHKQVIKLIIINFIE